MSDKSSAKSGGFGIVSLLGVVFVTLKLLGIGEVATWSWLWVLAPFWLGAAVVLGILAVITVIALIVVILDR